jgi:hypothetical protein
MEVAQVVAHGAELGAVFPDEPFQDLPRDERAKARTVGRVVEQCAKYFVHVIGYNRDGNYAGKSKGAWTVNVESTRK